MPGKEIRKTGMASTSFTSFLVLMILLIVRNSAAHTLQDEGKAPAAGKGIELEVPPGAVPAANKIIVQVEKARHGGRRMMLKSAGLSKGTEQEAEPLGTEIFAYIEKGTSNGKYKYKKQTMVGLTAFSADYRMPKSHPPKNN